MSISAPDSRTTTSNTSDVQTLQKTSSSYVAPSVLFCGAGGCGINIVRRIHRETPVDIRFFDTSMANSQRGESINLVTGGSGSGGVRATNAAAIQKELATFTDEQLPDADIVVVCFSLSGGTGSVLGPLITREYAKRGKRVVNIVVADTSSELYAVNTQNTLKTMVSIAKNNGIYLPVMLFQNNTMERIHLDALITEDAVLLHALLADEAIEVDRNDRINFLNGIATFNGAAGIRLISVFGENYTNENAQPLFSHDPTEMYDGFLQIAGAGMQPVKMLPQYSRFRKDGEFTDHPIGILGLISANISPINDLIDSVEKTLHVAKTQAAPSLDRLASSGDDLVL